MAPLTRNRPGAVPTHSWPSTPPARQRRPADHRATAIGHQGGLCRRARPVRHRAARRLAEGDRRGTRRGRAHCGAAVACGPSHMWTSSPAAASRWHRRPSPPRPRPISSRTAWRLRRHLRAARWTRRSCPASCATTSTPPATPSPPPALTAWRYTVRQRLPAGPVPQDRQQPPHRRLRRQHREPRPAAAGGDAPSRRKSGRTHRPAPVARDPPTTW